MPAPKDPLKNAEWRKKISNSLKGDKSPNYGKSPSEITRAKIGAKHKGKTIPQKMRDQISISLTGRKASEKTRKLLSEQRKGKPHSEEWCQHISESQKGKSRPKLSEDVERERRRKISLAMCGENAPSWKGGISFEPYCVKFNREFKERVRGFFDYKCVECGMIQEKNGRKLDVHHVNYDKMVCCNDVKPLFVALCRSCNIKANANRPDWEKHYAELIMMKFNKQCYLPKEVWIKEQIEKGG